MLTFPTITKHFFTVLGLIVVVAGAIVFLINMFSDGNPFSEEEHEYNPGRMTYWDASYNVLTNNWNKTEVENQWGEKYTYDKSDKRWRDSSGSIVSDPSFKGLDSLSNFHGW